MNAKQTSRAGLWTRFVGCKLLAGLVLLTIGASVLYYKFVRTGRGADEEYYTSLESLRFQRSQWLQAADAWKLKYAGKSE